MVSSDDFISGEEAGTIAHFHQAMPAFDFERAPDESEQPDAGHPASESPRSESRDGTDGLFGFIASPQPRRSTVRRYHNGRHPRPPLVRRQPTLFDFASNEHSLEQVEASPRARAESVQDLFSSAPPSPPSHPTIAVASSERGKANDILAAVRILKDIEREQRPATADERQQLIRFCGFGPVALSIFPNPVTGR